MVAAAGGAPAVITLTPRRTSPRASAGALASMISTVGAAHMCVTDSSRISRNASAGSTARRQTCAPPTAVTTHVNVQPLAWNMGSVQRYRVPQFMGQWTSVPTTFAQAFRWVIITPLGREVVPLV